jgi:hypothetical protein
MIYHLIFLHLNQTIQQEKLYIKKNLQQTIVYINQNIKRDTKLLFYLASYICN